jgi:1-aminocyclopropane-1-carboxylate deaminase/D-cysteine desulfhydrase-like pyridoxal-dependent ACC family enzyme
VSLIAHLPHVELARLPTPVEEAPRLARELGARRLRIKREDMSGAAFGGNKLRQIELILGEARARGADTVISTAGAQSNFCRALAGSAASLGIGCELLLRGAPGAAMNGNLLLDHVFGARVTFTDKTDPWDQAIRAALDAMAEALRAKGRTPMVVQLTGETAALGVAGWVSGAEEILAQGDPPDRIVVACGSALTLAGLALGFKHLGARTRVLGVSVQQPIARLAPWIVEAAAKGAAALGLATRLAETEFDLIDAVGAGYGKPTQDGIDAVRLAGRTQGLVLDPVYTGKALAGLRAGLASGAVPRDADVMFVHSGGAPGLFANAAAFQ